MRLLHAALAIATSGGCSGANDIVHVDMAAERPSAAASAASENGARSTEACPRFEPRAVDLGLRDVSSIALTSNATCALANGRLLCADRFGGAFREVLRDVDFLGGGGADRFIIAQRGRVLLSPRSKGSPDASFPAVDQAVASWGTAVVGARLVDERVTLLGADGSLLRFQLLRDGDSEVGLVERAPPSTAVVSEISTARSPLGQSVLGCERVGAAVRCRGRELQLPKPALDLGGNCVLLEGGQVSCFEVDVTRAEAGAAHVLATLPSAISVANDGSRGGCAVQRDGKVVCFGELEGFSALGAPPFERPTELEGIADAAEVIIRDVRACARTKDGRVLCFGCLALAEGIRALVPPTWPRADGH